MSRIETIAKLTKTAEQLSDEQLRALLELSAAMASPSVYSTLSAADRASIEMGIADHEAGRVVDSDDLFAAVDARIAAAAAR